MIARGMVAILLLVSCKGFAATANYQVMMLDTTSDSKALQKYFPGAEIHNLAEGAKLQRRDFLTEHEQRLFFQKTGLAQYVSKMDQVDRDLLVGFLRRRQMNLVHRRYQEIPAELCQRAANLLNSKPQ